jgi:Arc/MetJ-type ribon-helix-helix transcriptional regulator
MEKATLTISLPRMMKDFIEAKLREGRFSTPSEYIRSLIRDDQDLTGNSGVALMIRRGGWAGKTNKANGEPGAAKTDPRVRRIE